MSFDPVTLALARPKIVDLTKYPVNGGVIDGIDLCTQLLNMVNISLQNNGAVQKASVTFDDAAFAKKLNSKGNIVIKTTVSYDGTMIDTYLPTVVSIGQDGDTATNVYTGAVVNLDGLLRLEVSIVFDSSGLAASLHVKATPFT